MNKFTRMASIASVAIFASSAAHADSTGCGIGTMLFNGNKGVAPSVLAVTTNGTSGNQTFGISSGTLGCDQQNRIDSRGGRLFSFADENLNELAADTSKGEGEYLNVAASIIGIKENDQDRFSSVMQQNFSTIFSADANTQNVVVAIREVMQKDEVLRTYKI